MLIRTSNKYAKVLVVAPMDLGLNFLCEKAMWIWANGRKAQKQEQYTKWWNTETPLTWRCSGQTKILGHLFLSFANESLEKRFYVEVREKGETPAAIAPH